MAARQRHSVDVQTLKGNPCTQQHLHQSKPSVPIDIPHGIVWQVCGGGAKLVDVEFVCCDSGLLDAAGSINVTPLRLSQPLTVAV